MGKIRKRKPTQKPKKERSMRHYKRNQNEKKDKKNTVWVGRGGVRREQNFDGQDMKEGKISTNKCRGVAGKYRSDMVD